MRYRELGKSGIKASVIGMGMWVDEGLTWEQPETQNIIDTIHAAIDSGINLIDTAPVYGLGFSEELVGKAVAGKRDKVVLATKCGLVWNTNKGKHTFDEKGTPLNRYLGAESIRFELEESLRRLKTDYIDLYQIHVSDADRPPEEPMVTLMELKEEGKIRAIGACNITRAHLQAYEQAGQLDAIQHQYSLLDRRIEPDILPYCYNQNIAVLAYSPLLQGLMAGEIDTERTFTVEKSLQMETPSFSADDLRQVVDVLGECEPIAYRYGLTIPQLAIAWTVQSAGITHALIGATVIGQIQKAVVAGDASLSEEDVIIIGDAVESQMLIARQ